MWRKSLHEVGCFLESVSPYADKFMWIRAIAAGKRAVKMGGPPLALYNIRASSHNRRQSAAHQSLLDKKLWEIAKRDLQKELRHLTILVVHESLSLLSGGDVRMFQIVRWLASQGDDVFFAARLSSDPDAINTITPFVRDFSASDPHFSAVIQWQQIGVRFDMALLGTWFFRTAQHSGDPRAVVSHVVSSDGSCRCHRRRSLLASRGAWPRRKLFRANARSQSA